MNVNYDRVCRLCLSSRGELLPIFPTTSSDDSEPPGLASKIRDCVSVEISENDDLPSNVCRKCVDNVNNWHIFKTVCERTQNKLQSLNNKDDSLLEEIKVKNEPLSDDAYDDGVVIDGSYPDSENGGPSCKVQPEGPPILASLGLTPRSDKTYVDPRMDWQRVHAIMGLVQDDEVIDALQSTEESDVVHDSDHDSDSDAEMNFDIADDFVDCKNGYLCKNRQFLSKYPKLSATDIYVKVKNVLKLRKRNTNVSKHCPLPKNAWQLFFTDDLLELVVVSTNEKICSVRKGCSETTNASEIRKLIGILYLHGIVRPTHQKLSDLWHREYGIICVQKAMTLERFIFLLRNLSFDNEVDDSIIQHDVMKRIRKVFEIFALNCRTAFEIKNITVIDEIIVPVYGPCPFRYNIEKKSFKRGIKIVMAVDPSNFYVSNLDVITDPYFGPDYIVRKIVQHLAGTGRSIIIDSWYTSIKLIEMLKNEYQLYSIAALNPKDEIIPPLFLSKYRQKQPFMSAFLDHDMSLASYINTKSQCVNVLTNEPRFYKRNHCSHTSIVSVYKKNQSAVEVLDVLMHYYTTMQNTNDWTHSLFFTLLNIASVNAQVIWCSFNTERIIQRRYFIKELALSLLDNDEVPSLLMEIGVKRKRDIVEPQQIVSYKNRKRCRICLKTTKRDRRTKQFCIKCSTPICKEHTVSICSMCVS